MAHKPLNAGLLSCCMIVRDNADTIRPCLESIRQWVDDLVVVDTGSKDSTPQIAHELGARVFHFPWCDDFSAARNESLRHACGDWLFWMDSDDTIDDENGRKLRELVYGKHHPRTLGYVMQVHCPGIRRNDDLTIVDHVKLFRNHAQIRFEFRIHEQVLQSIRRLGGEVEWTDIFVVHSGSDRSPEGQKRKYERDLRILNLENQSRPNHPFVLFNLGMTYNDMGEHAAAVEYLSRCLDVSAPAESHLRKAYALQISSLSQLGRNDKAVQVCQQGLRSFVDDPELLFRQAMLSHAAGDVQSAEAAYLAAISLGVRWRKDQKGAGELNPRQPRADRHFTSIDPGILGHKSRHNLAVVYQDIGRLDLAEMQWRNALTDHPGYPPAQRSLIEALIRQRKITTAEVELEKTGNDQQPDADAFVLRAMLAEAKGDRPAATELLREAIASHRDDLEGLQTISKFLFDRDYLPEAESALQRQVELAPTDAAIRHNLGVVYLRRGNLHAAEAELRESLRLRPESALTREQLANVLESLGRRDEAALIANADN